MSERLAPSAATGAATELDAGAPDEELLARSAAGDLGALEILYDRHRTVAYSFALRITGDSPSAEDVVQDAFVGLWRNASRHVPSRGSVRTWLLSIVHHRAIDAVRRRRPADELPEDEVSMPASSTIPDVWAEVAGRLDRSAIVAAMATLSDLQREAIELAYYGGLTQQEIAARTGAPLGTVKSRVRLGLLALRDALVAAGAVDAPGTTPAAETADVMPAGRAGRAAARGAGADPAPGSSRPAGGGLTA